MILIDIVLLALAACHLTEVFRHGSIFDKVRAKLESINDFCNELVNCGFCFSHWASALVVFCLYVGHKWLESTWVVNPFILIIVWLTVTRLANLINDITKSISRTPSSFSIEDIQLEDKDNQAL